MQDTNYAVFKMTKKDLTVIMWQLLHRPYVWISEQ